MIFSPKRKSKDETRARCDARAQRSAPHRECTPSLRDGAELTYRLAALGRKVKNSQARTGHQRGMGGRGTDDDEHARATHRHKQSSQDTKNKEKKAWGRWGAVTPQIKPSHHQPATKQKNNEKKSLALQVLASVFCTFLAVAVAAPRGTARQQVSHTEAGPYVNDAQGLSWQGKGNDQNGKARNAFFERSEHRPLGPPIRDSHPLKALTTRLCRLLFVILFKADNGFVRRLSPPCGTP